jgi:hypothetical protein
MPYIAGVLPSAPPSPRFASSRLKEAVNMNEPMPRSERCHDLPIVVGDNPLEGRDRSF